MCFQYECMTVVCFYVLVCVKEALNPICCCSMSGCGTRAGLSVPAREVLFCLVGVLSVKMPQRALMFMQCESVCRTLTYYLVAERKVLHFHIRFPEAQADSELCCSFLIQLVQQIDG